MKKISRAFTEDKNIDFKETSGESFYRLSASPVSGEAALGEISVSFAIDFPFDRFFLNGYQSWTFCPERGVNEKYKREMRFCPGFLDRKFGFSKYGDRHFFSFKDKTGVGHGYSYAYVRKGDRFLLFASLCEHSGFTRILIDAGSRTVTFQKDCENRILKQGEYFPVFDLLFLEGSESEVFDRWLEALSVKPLTSEKAVGYTSWYNCYQNISEKRILEDLEGMRRLPAKPNIFQIDDGYETFVGDWLDVDEKKFPGGIKPIADKILSDGYKAGIWLAPFVCEKNSKLYAEHPEWLLRGEDGQFVFCGANWSGHFALNTLLPAVRAYVKDCIAHYRAMGFTLFKLDFLYAACMIPHDNLTRGELMADAVDLLREACGDCAIIGCGVPLASAFGKMEYCRVGPDVSLDYDDKPFMRLFHLERPSTKHTVQNTLYRRQLSGRAFLNDPDVFILRTENTTLTTEQKDLLCTVNGLFGGVLFASDEFSSYTEEQKSLYASVCSLMDAKDVQVDPSGKTLKIRYTLKEETVQKTFEI